MCRELTESLKKTIKLRNHHLSITVWPEGGRILDVTSLDTAARLVSWWPFKADVPERAGGIGERTVPDGAGPWRWKESPGSIALTRGLPGGLTLEKTIALPPDALAFGILLAVRNDSERTRALTLDQQVGVCPGCGGACPTAESGISNCREKAFLKRPGEQPLEVDYEVYESLRVERDDLEWAAFVDPVSDNLFAAVLPPGHSVVRTEYHWWLEWAKEIVLAPGGKFSADFRFAAARALSAPLIVSEHFLAGLVGRPTGIGERMCRARIYGLDVPAAGNAVTVSAAGKEFLSGKPLADSREPFEIELPGRDPCRDLDVEMTVGGKYGHVVLPAAEEAAALMERLDRLAQDAHADARHGKLKREKAASVMAFRRIAQLQLDRPARSLEPALRRALADAEAALASPLEPVAFFSDADKGAMERIAAGVDLDEAGRTIRATLEEAYDLSIPRFRAPRQGASALAKRLLEAALYLSARHDDEVLALFKTRLSEMTAIWARYGQVLYETIHHGTLLAHLVPAVKIASGAGLLAIEAEAEAQAMAFDLAAKIRRRGGRQFRLSNWWAMEAAPLAWLGVLYPYLLEAGDYVSFARESFYWLLVHGTLKDGGFWEMSASYHMVTLAYLWHTSEALLRAGEDCFLGETCARRLREMCEYYKKLAIPAGRHPAFEDSNRDPAPEVLLALAKRFGDGELAYHADAAFRLRGRARGAWEFLVPVETPRPVAPNRGSEILDASGKLILRSGGREITMVVDYGPHGGWHGHNDTLAFELFWRDKCVAPDAGSYRYEDALHWRWFRTADAHNTVTLGGGEREASQGRLVHFQEGPGFVTAAMEASTYRGVTHRREVTISDRTLLVDDFLVGARPGETLTWRMNSYEPIAASGNEAVTTRGSVTLTVAAVSADVSLEAAEVPLMPDEPGASEYVTGWQLRISKAASHDADRILVRLDFSW